MKTVPRAGIAGWWTIMESVEQSLRRLQTDYVDVLLVHWPDVTTPFDETMTALDNLVQQGKARAIGVSNFTLEQIKECVETRRMDVVQYGLNMFDRRVEQEIAPYCLEQGTSVMVYGPLAFGPLNGSLHYRYILRTKRLGGRPAGGLDGMWGYLPRRISSAMCE